MEVNITGLSVANGSPGDNTIDLDFDSARATPLGNVEYPICMLTASFLSSTMTSVHFGLEAVSRYRHHIQILSVRIEPILCYLRPIGNDRTAFSPKLFLAKFKHFTDEIRLQERFSTVNKV
jgi:hypothetical protein